jgi:N-acylneuraminate cytidylyltransferase/CMP-N,N'-diacetyllegionaminic acid synthase
MEVGGVSLVERAVSSAAGANVFAWVSTDDEAIALEAIDAGACVNRVDTVPAISNLRAEMWAWWEKLDDKPDALVLLNPTSPLRTAEHVREALALLERTGADSVVSVTEGHEPHFAGVLHEASDRNGPRLDWQPGIDRPRFASKRPRTQDLPRAGWENGAIFAVTRAFWEAERNFTGGHAVAYVMPRAASIDVDVLADLEIARAIDAWRGR